MTGHVDDSGRALVSLQLSHPTSSQLLSIEAWIDTGFTGGLVLGAEQIEALGLTRLTSVQGILVGGNIAEFETYACDVEWFGARKTVEMLSGTSMIALLGVQLLRDCALTIDYPARAVVLAQSPLM